MAAWAISLQGRIQLFFLTKGQMVDAASYAEQILADHSLPQITFAARAQKFGWQQDLARPHIAKSAFRRLNRNMKGHLNGWPSKGADLNPLDYAVWSQIQESAWQDKPSTHIELRTSAMRHLAASPTDHVESAIRAFPKRLQMRVLEQGGYFEYRPKKSKEEIANLKE